MTTREPERDDANANANSIAIVGMEGRFPGASDLDTFWKNLRAGVESITFFSQEPPTVRNGMAHVKAAALLEDMELFDASFFGFNPREAETMDPQIRVFLECAWSALESAGYDAKQYDGRIGVFAGCGFSTYLTANLLPNIELMRSSGGPLSSLGAFNDRDSLATLVSYKFDLTGPAVTVQTFCSTSLVAVHMGCQSLLNGESDLVLAGAATINVSAKDGYLYMEGGILSPDGHCRTFDEKAAGTIFGNGVGVVVLKRLEEALAEGDVIHAVIRGSAINNDGDRKAGYTAPSVVGQSRVIAEAMALAEVAPQDVSYVEAHGTGTALGDPIEIEALTRAFRTGTDARGFCAIGSLKTNIGHLDRAAGIAALTKTVLALKQKEIPPSLHFEKPNPKIDFTETPFVVNHALKSWESNGRPRVAGVSALGFGGTNAHVILQEAPPRAPSSASRGPQLLLLSARTEGALERASERLAHYLEENQSVSLADVAHTLRVGRRRFEHRRAVVSESVPQAVEALLHDGAGSHRGYAQATDRPVAFLFPGQGAQYVGMTRGLYDEEPVYRDAVDACCRELQTTLAFDLRSVLFAPESEEASARLRETAVTQPALFVVEYALAKLWMSFGVRPQAFLGHSVGEYVAAHLAGVIRLSDALALVAERGKLMQSLPAGSMLAVALPASEVESLLAKFPALSLAAVNAPNLSVVSGPSDEIDRFEQDLKEREAFCNRLRTSHAFHSAMMDPILEAFEATVAKVALSPPAIPYVSNLTGTWIESEEAVSPRYWVRHLREAVQFSKGVATLWSKPDRLLIEVGPGSTLRTLARQQAASAAGGAPEDRVAIGSLRGPRDSGTDRATFLGALGQAWIAGAAIDFKGLNEGERRVKLSLPTYPFERERYWVDAQSTQPTAVVDVSGKRGDVTDWFYVPTWQSALPADATGPGASAAGGSWLLFVDRRGILSRLAARLRKQGVDVVTVSAGSQFSGTSRDGFTIAADAPVHYGQLLKRIEDSNRVVSTIVHGWSIDESDEEPNATTFSTAQQTGYFSLTSLVQALSERSWNRPMRLSVVGSHLHEVLKGEPVRPEKATILGLVKVVPQEYHNLTCSCIDVDDMATPEATEALRSEIELASPGEVVAFRRGQRWRQHFEPVKLARPESIPRGLRENGVYLITGGLGGVTFLMASHLARTLSPRLVLTGRTRLPERSDWARWLASRGETDAVSQKIRKIQQLEAWGATVLPLSADAGDADSMIRVVEETESRFGALHGVIHGAGIVGGSTFRPLQQLGHEAALEQFHPKVAGLLALEKAVEGRKLDWCYLTSSLSSVLGGFAYGAYAAANSFMDAYTRFHNQRSTLKWVSVNWDEFHLTASAETGAGAPAASGLRAYAMTPAESTDAFGRIFTLSGASQIVVSTGDLRYRLDQWVKLEALRSVREVQKQSAAPKRHSRPNLQSAYVAPGTEVEKKIAAIWEELLGIEKVGIRDNFFELGGHSLLAIQLVTRIRAELDAEVSVASLFEGPTVSSLGKLLAKPEPDPMAAEVVGLDSAASERGARRHEERLKRQRKEREGSLA